MSGSGSGMGGTGQGVGQGSNPPMIQRKAKSMVPLVATIVVVVIIVLGIGVGGYSAGWFKAASSSSKGVGGCTLPGKTSVVGTGSTLVYPLMQVWEAFYEGGKVVNYNALGSSAGITAITGKTVAFGASDAPLNPSQRHSAAGILTMPESAGGVVPIYNLPSTVYAKDQTHLNFNGSILAQIYDNQITNWNNTELQTLNPGAHLPDATINPVHRSDGSGTSFIFTSFLTLDNLHWAYMYGKGTAFPTNVTGTGQGHNAGVAAYVTENSNTIGYVDLEYALTSGSAVGIGAVKNPSGNFIVANVTDTTSALTDSHLTLPSASGDWYNVSLLNAPGTGDYPITSLTYLLIWPDLQAAYPSWTMTNAENLVDFLHWVISSGQAYAGPLSYIPLPSFITTADNATINSITFGATPIPVCVPS
jgi:phosphate transport system substrate-binding protein